MANDDTNELGFGLAEVIENVRLELEKAVDSGKASTLAFTAGPVELEFEVALTKDREGNAGIQVWVLSAGAQASRSTSTTHRVTITLTPRVRATGKDVIVGDVGRE